MSYLMNIAFDSSERFLRKIHYLSYKTYRFKLIQNDGKRYANALITLLDRGSSQSQEGAYRAAGEFLAALAWERDSIIHLGDTGGVENGAPSLLKAKCQLRQFRGLPYMGRAEGGLIDEIAKIENEHQARALTLYREARSTNNHYLQFIFYWQILEVRNSDPVNLVDKILRKTDGKVVDRGLLNRLTLDGHSVGQYLYHDCRCAIAHLRRQQGKATITLDSLKDAVRIGIGTKIVEDLANHYIREHLGVKDTVYLVKRRSGDRFPFYATLDEMQRDRLYLAYDRWIPGFQRRPSTKSKAGV